MEPGQALLRSATAAVVHQLWLFKGRLSCLLFSVPVLPGKTQQRFWASKSVRKPCDCLRHTMGAPRQALLPSVTAVVLTSRDYSVVGRRWLLLYMDTARSDMQWCMRLGWSRASSMYWLK